ncbi:MAG: calcium/proton exchanger [Candidatus Dormiibacterota bacterium]
MNLLKPSLSWLLVFLPVAIFAEFSHLEVLAFITSALTIIPLAGLIGEATDQFAIRTGPRLGGLINATFGNLTELVVGVFLILNSDFEVVRASLIGSIVGNLLLVLGASLLAGGLRHSELVFNRQAAGVHASSLLLAVAALVFPAIIFATRLVTPNQGHLLSAGVGAVLIVLYIGALLFTQVTHSHLFGGPTPTEVPRWTMTRSLVVLGGSALLVGYVSEILVSSLRPALEVLPLSPLFVGLILVPVVGNAAEHASAIYFAMRNKVDLTLEIAIGSSAQVALFIAPVLVFISLAVSRPMDFVFSGFEIAAVALATLIVAVIALDGRSNWLEGAQLLGVYLIIAVGALFA